MCIRDRDGVVDSIGYNAGGYGYFIVINSNRGESILYGHGSGYPLGIVEGAPVKKGQIVFISGNTGASSGAHLHAEYHPVSYTHLTGNWQVFEMEKLMANEAIVAPTLDYLFHRIESQLTGYPTPVSYTHLDVYKRQGSDNRPGIEPLPGNAYPEADILSSFHLRQLQYTYSIFSLFSCKKNNLHRSV